jgi:hypothetical protein
MLSAFRAPAKTQQSAIIRTPLRIFLIKVSPVFLVLAANRPRLSSQFHHHCTLRASFYCPTSIGYGRGYLATFSIKFCR